MSDHGILLTLKAIGGVIISGAIALFGGWDALMTGLVVMVSIDYLTGLIAAAINGKLDSTVGWKGILKKVLVFLIVAVAATVDKTTGVTGNVLRSAACLFYIGNEGISIVENLGRAGVRIPAQLKNLFARLRAENDDKK
jgi:toxin secretion/phage lysis holin